MGGRLGDLIRTGQTYAGHNEQMLAPIASGFDAASLVRATDKDLASGKSRYCRTVTAPLWQVYVEFETASLQDTDLLRRLSDTLSAGSDVVDAVPTIGSRGSQYSLAASITVRSQDRDAACDYAKELLQDACADVGYQTGRVKTLSGTRR